VRALRNRFWKGHALGNDYLVVDPRELDFRLTPRRVRALCDRHRGVGGDGVLELLPSRHAHFGLRIWNPDGSRAEKSGNGLRIFARFLQATGRTRRTRLQVETEAGVVAIRLFVDRDGAARRARVEMGRASFAHLPSRLRDGELLQRPIRVAGRKLRFTGVSIGNPHCVVFAPRGRRWSRADLLALGPRLERHPSFPKRCNVQLATRVGPHALRILIWERGAGETAASGSSACAAACAAIKLGLLTSPVVVHAPGGALHVSVSDRFDVTLEGSVEEVASGALAPAFVRALR
jgi:diaminopimelate epimerase